MTGLPRALAQLGGRIQLHLLPPSCPEGNRIERVWLDLRANVTRNHRCRTFAKLMVRVHAYLAGRNAQRSASPFRAEPTSGALPEVIRKSCSSV